MHKYALLSNAVHLKDFYNVKGKQLSLDDKERMSFAVEAFCAMTNVSQITSRLYSRKVLKKWKQVEQVNHRLENKGSFAAGSKN